MIRLHSYKPLLVISALILLCTSCSGTGASGDQTNAEDSGQYSDAVSFGLEKCRETGMFVYYYSVQDETIIDDIDDAMNEHCPEICNDLECDYGSGIIIYIFPDQGAYDGNIPDKGVAGSPASSGDGKIYMVSPVSPIAIEGIPYDERLLMAVHEFAHIMLNRINSDAPMWLQEGTASYEGSKDGYDELIKSRIDSLPPLDFAGLESSYYDLPMADVYSYIAVRYIAGNYGYESLRRIIRQPQDFEKILQLQKSEFEDALNAYIEEHYQ